MSGIGLIYEGKPDDEWDHARRCTLHNAYEMFHTCAGGPGEPLGYCAAWDGTKDNGWPSCRWASEEGAG